MLNNIKFYTLQFLITGVCIVFGFAFRDLLPSSYQPVGLLSVKLPLMLLGSSLIVHHLLNHASHLHQSKLKKLDLAIWSTVPISGLLFLFQGSGQNLDFYMRVLYIISLSAKAGVLGFSLYLSQKKGVLKPVLVFLTALWFFTCFSFVYLPAHSVSGDEPHYLMMADSIVNDLDLNLYNQYFYKNYSTYYSGVLEPKPSDIDREGEIFSRGLGATFPLAIAPSFAIAGYSGTIFFMVLCSALLILQLYLLLLKESLDGTAIIISVMLIASSIPVLTYSCLIYPDILAALLIVTALRCLQIPPLTQKGRSVPTMLVVISTVLIFLKFRYFAPVCLLLFPLFFGRYRNKKRNIILCFTLLAFGIIYIYVDRSLLSGDLFSMRFGNWTSLRSFIPGFRSLGVLPGLVLDQESGLLIYAPVYLFAAWGFWTHQGKKSFTFHFAWLAPLLTIISLLGHFAWHCLPTPPLRYLLPVLPVSALLMTSAISSWRSKSVLTRGTMAVVVGMNWFMGIIMTLNPGFMVNMADGSAEVFVKLGQRLHLPVHLFFPSFIRLNSAAFVWLILLGIIAWILYQTSKANPFNHSRLNGFVPVCLVLAVLCGSFIVWSRGRIHTYQCEDRDWIVTDHGRYEPVIRDPFFHQETNYGWQIDPGTFIEIPLRLNPDDYSVVVSARLVTSLEPQIVTIKSGETALARFIVTKKSWTDYGFRLPSKQFFETLRVEAKESNRNSVAVNSVRFHSVSRVRYQIWKQLAALARIFSLNDGTLYCMKRAFFSLPGHPWKAVSYANPGTISPATGSVEIKPEEMAFMNAFIQDIVSADWETIHDMELLTTTRFLYSLPTDQKCDYFLSGLVNGNQTVAKKISQDKRCSKTDEIPVLQRAVAHYLTHDMEECINLLAGYLCETDRFPLSLSQPGRFVDPGHPLYPILMDLEENPRYQERIPRFCDQFLLDSIAAYHRGDYKQSSQDLDRYYQCDRELFMEKVPMITPDFLTKTFRYLCRLHPQDTERIIDIGFKKGRFRSALAAGDYGLRMFPNNAEIHYSRARTLYHMGEIDRAREACLVSMALCHDADRSRWLMEQIYKTSFTRSAELGSVREEVIEN